MVNPHLAYALVIFAGLDGVRRKLLPPEPMNVNLYTAEAALTSSLATLPGSLAEARKIARESPFIRGVLPEELWKDRG